jgi:hypothetical protein
VLAKKAGFGLIKADVGTRVRAQRNSESHGIEGETEG